MSKPEFSKPFNILDAKAGAPYCCRDGRTAQVLKWDRNVSDYPMMGVVGKSDDPRTWTATGSATYGAHGAEYDCDLVMLPLGLIDGKPVFVGDKITSPDCKGDTTAHHKMNFGEKSTWAWPVSAPTYPVTLMTDGDLVSNYYGGGPVSHDQEYQAWRRIANAALRHAIDAGQVVLPDTAPSDDLLMKVAVAVQLACSRWTATPTNDQSKFTITQEIPDLASIIAIVTGTKDAKEGAK